MRMKRILGVFLCAALIFTLLPAAARAASDPGNYIFDVSEGSITVGAGTSGGTLKVSYGASQTLDNIPASQELTITGTTTANTVTVSSGVTVKITLSGVSIDVSGISDDTCAFDMTGATVKLTLAGGTSNTLKSGNECAGIQVPAGASLTIDGVGTLTASSHLGAGIGSGDGGAGGTVIIKCGDIIASSYSGAGIGGGADGAGGAVAISGGTVSASSTNGAGVGGGYEGEGGTVTISGGTVSADSNYGAGVGGGNGGAGGTVTISGGIVIAYGYSGAGIGGGRLADGGTVTVSGGAVSASSYYGAGIGGGYDGHGGDVAISGGSVKATGDTTAENIGHGNGGAFSGTLTNGTGQNVYLTTVTLDGVTSETAVSVLTTSLDYTYGINDMQTDADGKLYLYLPENAKTTAVRTSAGTYTGDITTTADHNAAGTLSMSPATYTISYNANGGNGTMADGTATHGVAFTLPPNGFIAPDGKQFKEWAIGDVVTGAKVAAGDSYTFTAPTTVYAVWEDATPPSVTGVTPGGTGAPVSGNIAITFSEAMDTTVADAVYLSADGGTTYGSALSGGSWSVGNTVYTVPYSGLSYSTEYTVKIEDFTDAAGNTMAADSTHGFTTCDEPLVPSVSPSALAIDKGGTASFTVAFGQGASMATSADITVANGGIASVSQTQVTAPGSFTVTGLAAGTTEITVVFNDTASTTATVSVTVRAVAPTWPSGSSLTASGVTRTGATLSWTAARDVTAVTGYKLYQDGAEIATVAGDVYSRTVNGLSPSTSYTFQVQAGNADGEWSVNGPAVMVQTQSSGSSGGGSSSSGGGSGSTQSKPAYTAGIKTDNRADTTLPVIANADTGSAAVNMGVQQGNTISDGGNVTVIMPSIPGVGSFSLGVPAACLMTPGGGSLTFDTDAGSIALPGDMLAGVSGAEGKNAEITIGQGDKTNLPDDIRAAIGDRPLISLSLLLDGMQTDWSNPDAPVTVSIPYTQTEDELKNPDSIVVWYIDGSGNPQCVTNGHYDPATGTVTFDVTHFSNYAVVYNPVSFNDVKSEAWHYKAVSFIAARDITNGTGSGNFSPDAHLTRGDFLVMLMKAYGIAPDTSPADNFSDAGNTYYTGYLAAAKRLGISAGVGGNMYAPGKEITRQEMFTLLYNALKVIGHLPDGDSGKTLSDFSDSGSVADWAKDAMTLLVKTGTVGGSSGKLNPTGTTTRAEMAQVLYNLLGRQKA